MATSMKITRLTAGKIDILLTNSALRRNAAFRARLQGCSTVTSQGILGRHYLQRTARHAERKWARISTLNSCGPCQTYCTTGSRPPSSTTEEKGTGSKAEEETTAIQADATPVASETSAENKSPELTSAAEEATVIQAEAKPIAADTTTEEKSPVSISAAEETTVIQAEAKPVAADTTTEEKGTESTSDADTVKIILAEDAPVADNSTTEEIGAKSINTSAETTITETTDSSEETTEIQAEAIPVASEITEAADKSDDIAPVLKDSDVIETLVDETDEPDILYKKLVLEVKGHDKKVLHSYEYFVRETAKHLELKVLVTNPRYDVFRQSVLASAHIFKKHQVQYEERTYYKVFEFKHLTGSTADTMLEYIQRNLPEGTAMKVTKHQVLPMPPHLRPPTHAKQIQS